MENKTLVEMIQNVESSKMKLAQLKTLEKQLFKDSIVRCACRNAILLYTAHACMVQAPLWTN